MKKELIICALLAGFASAAMTDLRNKKTMGVSASDIRAAKADCEKSLPREQECVMVFTFEPLEADYEAN